MSANNMPNAVSGNLLTLMSGSLESQVKQLSNSTDDSSLDGVNHITGCACSACHLHTANFSGQAFASSPFNNGKLLNGRDVVNNRNLSEYDKIFDNANSASAPDDGIRNYGFTTATRIQRNPNPFIAGVLVEQKFVEQKLSYSFVRNNAEWGVGRDDQGNPDVKFNETNREFQVSEVSGIQKVAHLYWLDQFASVSGLTFERWEGDTGSAKARDEAVLKFGNEALSTISANARFPNSHQGAGNVFYGPGYDNPIFGNYSFYTLGHEVGHALGLSHDFEAQHYNVKLPDNENGREYSVMAYGAITNNGSASGGTDGNVVTLMMSDIAAIQYMYGANYNYNSGSTTYSFDPRTGEMSVDGLRTGMYNNQIFRTIWDGNGNDTYDFSKFSTNLYVDLQPGRWSDLDVGGGDLRVKSGNTSARGHVYNAMLHQGDTRSLIENANGGSGNDRIEGNQANNVLRGNGGNDEIVGNAGNDQIYGGTGIDTAVFKGSRANYTITTNQDGSLTIDGIDGRDLVYADVERIQFINDRIYGRNELSAPTITAPPPSTGAGRLVSVGSDGTVWKLDSNDGIERLTGNNWVELSGTLASISVASDTNVWGVNAGGDIWQWNGTAWSDISKAGLNTPVDEVSVGEDGTVWALGTNDSIWQWNNGSNSWSNVQGGLENVSVVAANNVWGVNAGGDVWQWSNRGLTRISTASISTTVREIDAGADGTVIAIGEDDSIWQHNGSSWSQSNGLWTQILGGLEQVSVGSAGNIWGVNQDNLIYQYNGQNWTNVSPENVTPPPANPTPPTNPTPPNTPPEVIKQVSVGSDGTVWNIGDDESLEQRTGNSWQDLSGGLASVSVASDTNVWGVNAGGDIWQWSGNAWTGISQTGIDGPVDEVSVGEDGTVWALGTDDSIWEWNGSNAWDPILGGLETVSVVNGNNVWGANAGGDIWQWNGNAWSKVATTGITTTVSEVDAAADGTVWALGVDDSIWARNGASWSQVSGALEQVSVGNANNIWGVSSGGDVYQYDGANWSAVQA